MIEAEIVAVLGQTPAFRRLPHELLLSLARLCTKHEFTRGELIFEEGQTCDGFYLILDGGVKLYRETLEGREQVLHKLREGATFAEAALLKLGTFPASAVAEQKASLLRIEGAGFLKLFREHESLAGAMVASLSGWLLNLVARVEELSVISAGARLAHYIVRIPSRDEAGQMVVDLPMSKKDLAAYLSITPETLSRMLRRWADRGIIAVDRRKLSILDGRILAAIADREESA
ncbi:MAG: CRP-like cAMP-binding protein [Planctomycetota bacterium]|jgi:CRP-like cAMP-binding protein